MAAMARDIKLPDIGDFKNVPIIEILVKPGQTVAKEEADRHARKRQGDARRARARSRRDRRNQGQSRRQGEPGRAAGDDRRRRRRAGGEPKAPDAPRLPLLPPRRSPCPGLLRRPRPISNATSSGARRRSRRLYRRVPRRRSRRRRSCWSNAARRSAASASMSAASRPRLCCTRPKSSTKPQASAAHGVTFAQAEHRSRRIARLEGQRRQAADRRADGARASQRKVTVVTGEGKFASPNTLAVDDGGGRKNVSRSTRRSSPPAPNRSRRGFIPKRPAHLRFDRRARDRQYPQAHAGARRRHHRAGDGDRLSCARARRSPSSN